MASYQDKLIFLSGLPRSKLPDVRHLAECRVDAGSFNRQGSTYWKGRDNIFLKPFPLSRLDLIPALVSSFFFLLLGQVI